jgi:antitoxin component HigA of HigAB toxin-antitoxin module
MRKNNVRSRAVADDYLKLIRVFPLRPIRNKVEYDDATRIHVQLVVRADAGLSDGEADYMQVLGRLIRDYDESHSALLKDTSSPVERLKFLMSEHDMNTIDLGKLLGSGSGQASMILNGKRELSKANIRTLAEHFKVSVAAFM